MISKAEKDGKSTKRKEKSLETGPDKRTQCTQWRRRRPIMGAARVVVGAEESCAMHTVISANKGGVMRAVVGANKGAAETGPLSAGGGGLRRTRRRH